MTNKELFISEIENLLNENENLLSDKAKAFFQDFKTVKTSSKGMTETGLKIILAMQENYDEHTAYKAKTIGEWLSISSRSVSGSMRKLVEDGYIEKSGKDPVTYSLTQKGLEYKVI